MDNNDSSETEGGLLAKASDIAFDIITGTTVPAPVRRNALKAFGQLCTAVVDIPVAYFEGKAAEIRAATEARTKIISTGGTEIARQMQVPPEYAKAAVKRFGEKIIRERINLDKICEVAAHEIANNSGPVEELHEANVEEERAEEPGTISDDFLNTFENEACTKSTEEMQLLLGRILAGEIQKPGSFSVRTLKLVGELDTEIAKRFQGFCSIAICLRVPVDFGSILDVRVVSLNGNAAANSLKDFGLSFAQLNTLHEYGLIIPDFNSYFDYKISIANADSVVALPFHFQNKSWGLVSDSEINALRLHGVALSKAGQELFGIMPIEPAPVYAETLSKYFESRKLRMVEVSFPATKKPPEGGSSKSDNV